MTNEIHELKTLMVALLEKVEERPNQCLGDWIPEKMAIKITGVSQSTLMRLRKSGQIRSSFLSERSIFYRAGDIKRLLDKHEKLR